MTKLVAMTTMANMYVVNFVNKLPKVKKKKDTTFPFSTIFFINRHIWYVCVGLKFFSSKLPFDLIFG